MFYWVVFVSVEVHVSATMHVVYFTVARLCSCVQDMILTNQYRPMRMRKRVLNLQTYDKDSVNLWCVLVWPSIVGLNCGDALSTRSILSFILKHHFTQWAWCNGTYLFC